MSHPEPNPAAQIHWTAQQVAALWNVDEKTVYRLFEFETGVMRFGTEKKQSIRIPDSILRSVHARLTGSLPFGSPVKQIERTV